MPDGQKLGLKLRDYGEFLATRSQGQKVRMAAIGLLAEHPDARVLVLNFEGVEAITNGCADEMVAKLIEQQNDRRILITRCAEGVWDAIATTLARRGLDVDDHFSEATANHQPSADLRQRYAEALEEAMHRDICKDGPCVASFEREGAFLADAALAVRDEELAALRSQLRASAIGRRDLHAAADRAGRDADEQRRRADQAETAIARVRALHEPITLYERCGHGEHDPDMDPEPFELDDGSWTCSTRTWKACRHCCCEGDEESEACEPGKCWPCQTIRALDGEETSHG